MKYPPDKPLVPTSEFVDVPAGEYAKMTRQEMIDSYQPIFAQQAYSLSLLGKKNKELADFFDVTMGTLNKWCELHSDFHAAMRDGHDLADSRVAKALYDRAVGMEFDKEVTVIDKATMQPITYTTKEVILPDVAAAKTWLQSRQSEKWRESKQLEVTTEKKKTINDLFDDLNEVDVEDDDAAKQLEEK